MAEQTTRVVLEIKWNPENDVDHPSVWDFPTLLEGDPFGNEGSHRVKIISFEDISENGEVEQV